MAKLPRNIIKKYGISKKAWSVYRGQSSSKRGTANMARKKFRRSAKRGFFGKGDNLLMTALAAGVYGGFRSKIEQYIQPISSKIPLVGAYSDEALLGTAGFLLAKGKIPMLKGSTARSIGKAVVIIEAARIGSGVINQVSTGSASSDNFSYDAY